MLGFLLLPITGPFKGLRFIAEHITEEAERSFYDEAGIRATLLELEMQLQDGAITEEEYLRDETSLLERLALAMRRRGTHA
ncbi:MAG: gas vesicle protein GvpG [Chloroflexi bacterium]|nr:gas vesicle protein GvpG [Chloroflexota bacterium]